MGVNIPYIGDCLKYVAAVLLEKSLEEKKKLWLGTIE
jgi:hypothetical protein